MKTRTTSSSNASPGNTLAPGTTLAGRYQIEKVIGTGGMGAVYSARDRRFRSVVRRCAVKEMFDNIADPTARQRARENFEREANLLASLNHSSIPKVFDYFTEGERHYLVYEFIEGQDLARVLHQRARPLPPDRVVDWALQLTRVLETLHNSQPPIIFRDLKPSNVMLRGDGQIVLVDFGIAKHFQPVQKGTMIGTEGYAPPEQYEGIANPRVDVYALGASMHQLLTNTDPQEYRPFSYNQRAIRQYNPVVSADLDGIVMRALSYDSAQRWEDMRSMRKALERAQSGASQANARPSAPTGFRETGTPTSAANPAGPSAPSSLFARRLRGEVPGPDAGTRPVGSASDAGSYNIPPSSGMTRPVGGTQNSTGVPGAGPFDGGTRRVGAPPPPEPAVSPIVTTGPFDAASQPAIVPAWTFATEDEVRSTPQLADQSLYIGSYDTNLYCLNIETGDFQWKYATQGGIPGTPAVAGQLVIVGSEDHQVYGINRHTGRPEWTAQTQGRIRSSPRVALDHVFVGSDDGHVYAFSLRQGHLVWKAAVGSPVRSSAFISEPLLYIGAEDGSVIAMDILSGEIRWRIRATGPVISSPTVAGERVVFGSMDRQVYGADQKSGWIVWRVRLSDRVYSSPFVKDDRIYICAVDGTVYCLDAEWGKEIWKTTIPGQITSSPIVDASERLYVGSVNKSLYCLDARKGKIEWSFETGGAIPGSPREHRGIVYFGSMDHRVYALPTESAPRRF